MKKISNIIFLGIILSLIVSVSLISLFGNQKNVSYYEQRSLAVLPTPSIKTLLNGDFFDAVENYAADHIAGRDMIVKTDTAINLHLQRPTVNGLVTHADALVPAHGFSRWNLDYITNDAVKSAEYYATLQNHIQSFGGYFCYVGVPQQSTYFADSYPSYMDNRLWHTETIRRTFSDAMNSEGVPFIDMHVQYNQMGFPKNYYYETDHHFTLKGAFVAYQTLMQHLQNEGLLPNGYLDSEAFIWETLPNPFLGSANRKLYGLRETADTIEIASPKEEIPFIRTNNGQPADGIYSLPVTAQETVTYSVYMGGDIGETIIQTNRPDLPDVLIFGDSFTNAIETLLWTNFNETRSLDFRYFTEKTLLEYIDDVQPDIVICIRDEMKYLEF